MHLVFLVSIMVVYSSISSINAESSCKPTEAMLHAKHWYQFFDCPKTWDEARRSCERDMIVNHGQSLVSSNKNKPTLIWLENEEESKWLENQLNYRYGAKLGIWLGGRRQGSSVRDPFYWEVNEPDHGSQPSKKKLVRYTQFADNEPSRRYINEDCLALIDNYYWADIECQTHMRYVCKSMLASPDIAGAEGLPNDGNVSPSVPPSEGGPLPPEGGPPPPEGGSK